MEKKYVRRLILAPETEQVVATAEIRVGDIGIRDMNVCRSSSGKLSVFFPGRQTFAGWKNSIALPAPVRSEIEAELVAAYREEQREHERKADAK
jgi:hypothetical protein